MPINNFLGKADHMQDKEMKELNKFNMLKKFQIANLV